MTNNFLIQTRGSAFSSLEITHYKDINDEIINVPREVVDIFGHLQQIPAQ